MKIVIDIPEGEYELCKKQWDTECLDALMIAVKYGTPLPKGHGRLIDADKTYATAWVNFFSHEDEWQKKDKDFVPIGRFYCQNGFDCCLKTFVDAPAIIEADKEIDNERND